MKRTIYTTLLVSLLLIIGVVYYVFNKPHRNVDSEKPAVRISSIALFRAYSDNEKLADSLYLNKTLEVQGEVSEIVKDQKGERVFVLKTEDDIFGVVCSVDELEEENRLKAERVKVGDVVFLKGICNGFISDVKLNKCVILDIGSNKPAAI